MSVLTFKQLLVYNIHIGHKLVNCNIYAAWIIYRSFQKLWILDLKITLHMLNISIKLVRNIIGAYGAFWFVNRYKIYKNFIQWIGKYCGEISVGEQWKPGMISNFLNVGFRILLENNLKYRLTWPRGVLITSTSNNLTVLAECNKISIVNMSIIDSNINCFGVKFVIPGNDDNFDSFLFYNLFFANLILKEKFFQIFLWYKNIWSIASSNVTYLMNIKINKFTFVSKLVEYFYKLLHPSIGKYVFLSSLIHNFERLNNYYLIKLFWIVKLNFFSRSVVSKKKIRSFFKSRFLKKINLIKNCDVNKKFIIFWIVLKILFKLKKKRLY